MRTYITILHKTVRILVNFKHRIGYRYRLISALKISVIGTSAKSHIGASLNSTLYYNMYVHMFKHYQTVMMNYVLTLSIPLTSTPFWRCSLTSSSRPSPAASSSPRISYYKYTVNNIVTKFKFMYTISRSGCANFVHSKSASY